MNYLLMNLILFVGVSSLSITHEREIQYSLHYLKNNWEGITELGYEKLFKEPMPSVDKFDEMTRSLSRPR